MTAPNKAVQRMAAGGGYLRCREVRAAATADFFVSSERVVASVGALCQYHTVKVREIVRRLEDDGWYWVRTRGSHHQYRHRTKPGLVTVPGRPGDDLAPGTMNSILRQGGLK